MTCGRSMQIRTATVLEIDYDPESVEQDVLLELMQDAGRVEQLSILALLSRQPRISSRLREHRRYTHPLIVILGRETVNRPSRATAVAIYFVNSARAAFSAFAFFKAASYCVTSAL